MSLIYELTNLHATALHTFFKASSNVQLNIESILAVLDHAYGIDRDMKKDLGGYAVILESADDVKLLKKPSTLIWKQQPLSMSMRYPGTSDTCFYNVPCPLL